MQRIEKLNSMFSVDGDGFVVEPILYESGETKQSETRPFCIEELEEESSGGSVAGFVDHQHPTRPVFYIDTLSKKSDKFILDTADHEFHHSLFVSLEDRYGTSELVKDMEIMANRFMNNIGEESL